MSVLNSSLFFIKVTRMCNIRPELLRSVIMIFTTQRDSLVLWQIYLFDPASITMEGILIFRDEKYKCLLVINLRVL